MPDYESWVSEQVIVDALYSQGVGRHAQGRVIGYTNRPTLIIETASGERISWIADMCQLAADPTPVAGDWDRVHNRPADIYTPPEDRVERPSSTEGTTK